MKVNCKDEDLSGAEKEEVRKRKALTARICLSKSLGFILESCLEKDPG